MSDERLRDLERRAAAGEAEAALALAAALERLGRPDDALDALLPARADARVRREVGRWTERWRLGDVKPVRRSPRVRWSVALPGERPWFVDVHPLAVVVASSADRHTYLLDPDTGAVRARIDGFAKSLAGDLCLRCERGQVTGWDAGTGALALDAPLIGEHHAYAVAGDLLARCARGWLRVERLPEPRTNGWHHELGTILLGRPELSGDRVVVWGQTLEKPRRPDPWEARGLDLEGRLVWRREGDGHVWIGSVGGGEVVLEEVRRLSLLDRDGEARWSCTADALSGFTPETLLVRDGDVLRWLDRATGEERARPEKRSGLRTAVALARDVTAFAGRGRLLSALDASAAPVWELELPEPGNVFGLWPGHGRLFVQDGRERLLCVEDAP